MNITAQFHGLLADWVGTPSASFELAEDSTYVDLMLEIGRRYRQNMPDQLWDQKAITIGCIYCKLCQSLHFMPAPNKKELFRLRNKIYTECDFVDQWPTTIYRDMAY